LALKMVEFFNAQNANHVFPEILEEEWDPELYRLIPRPQSW
jgi:uncharacterized protein HemY